MNTTEKGAVSELAGKQAPEYAPVEHLRYAVILSAGVKFGFVLLVLSFLAYVSGLLEPMIPLEDLPKYWGLPIDKFVAATHTPTGWGWAAHIGNGDMLNLVGIAVLAGISMICSLVVAMIFARRGERVYLVIAILLVAVLAVAAADIIH